jgi:hypothetical protein
MGSSLRQEGVDHAGIELPRPRLELFPIDRDFDGVGV